MTKVGCGGSKGGVLLGGRCCQSEIGVALVVEARSELSNFQLVKNHPWCQA